ncbi:hypothetical protein ACS0TY_003946 [Phlomoides rotata]
MAEEEVMAEVETVQAVYGDDCKVVGAYPPHFHLHLMPRTADVTSQQFVEATIGIRAGFQRYVLLIPRALMRRGRNIL